MAAFTASISPISCSFRPNQVSNLRNASLSFGVKGFPSYSLPALRFRVACAAKPDTVDKVCKIVRQQLALPDDRDVNGESKFATLGADSLDTVEIVMGLEEEFGISVEEEKVEIVMGLEEEFGISVEEESAQSIATVQDAAELIKKLLEKK